MVHHPQVEGQAPLCVDALLARHPLDHRVELDERVERGRQLRRRPRLRLVAELSSFDRLRQRLWSNTAADDFDELELKRKGKPILYAQRERDRWTDRNHKLVKRDAGRILSRLVGATIRGFIDDPLVASKTSEKISGAAEYQAVFTDRAGDKTILTISASGDGASVGALSSARPGAPFRLDRTVLEAWRF